MECTAERGKDCVCAGCAGAQVQVRSGCVPRVCGSAAVADVLLRSANGHAAHHAAVIFVHILLLSKHQIEVSFDFV